jgi:hypothetical protein
VASQGPAPKLKRKPSGYSRALCRQPLPPVCTVQLRASNDMPSVCALVAVAANDRFNARAIFAAPTFFFARPFSLCTSVAVHVRNFAVLGMSVWAPPKIDLYHS